MKREKVLIRCSSCGAVNRLPTSKLTANPRCGKCKAALTFSSQPIELSAPMFESEVLRCPGLVLLEFFAQWCGPCRMFAPTLKTFAQQMAGIVKVAQVDVDKEPALAKSYAIHSTPTILLIENGKVLDKISGALPLEQLTAWVHRQ